MKYAIDRYAVGKEIEVSADKFDVYEYIPRRTERFYCPECGELVFFRNGGGFQSSHFYHKGRTSSTPECDFRVDGRSGLSLSQRVGLSLFLKNTEQSHFQLCIGFPPLETRILDKAAKEQWRVSVTDGTRNSVWLVNHSNFIANETTLLPVDFIPSFGKNYQIRISGKGILSEIQKKWSDYADGFSNKGAIFVCDEYCGKKVRRGDSISTHRTYYAVSKIDLRSFSNVKQGRVGGLNIGGDGYNVFKVEINLSADDKLFQEVANYYNQMFGVWLLECPPELIPIWPPVIQQDYLIPIVRNCSIICAISSGNKNPNVFEYSEYGVSSKEITHEYNSIKTVEISVGSNPVTLSVDRKYVGRAVSFLSKSIPIGNYKYEILFETESGSVISYDDIKKKYLCSGFKVFTNSKMVLFVRSDGQMFRQFCISSHDTEIPPVHNVEELYFLVDSYVILNIRCNKNLGKMDNDKELVKRILSSKRSQLLPIPYWVDFVIRKQRISHNDDLYNAIISTIKNGCIPAEVLRVLRMIV